MKKKSNSQSAFLNSRTFIGLALCLFGFAITLIAAGVLPGTGSSKPAVSPAGAKPGSQRPDIITMAGPVSQDLDLRLLPYVPSNGEHEEQRLMRHSFPLPALTAAQSKKMMAATTKLVQQTIQTVTAMNL